MTKHPLTEPERMLVADSLASVEWIMHGRVKDDIIELIDRLVMLLELPKPRRFAKYGQCWEPSQIARTSLTIEHLDIIIEWLDATAQIYDGRVSYKAACISNKLHQEMHRIIEYRRQQLVLKNTRLEQMTQTTSNNCAPGPS